jgi:Ser/Thr protein kinase RdoA (MazF antagonist)
MKCFGPDLAAAALSRWDADPDDLELLGTSGNTVYRVARRGEPHVLRLTDVGYRAPQHNEAEMAFLAHLAERGARVSTAVPSRAGRNVEILDGCTASVLTWAPGIRVEAGSPHWNESFLRDWGRALGGIHAASRSYDGPRRWEWKDEVFLAEAERLLATDRECRAELRQAISRLEPLPRTARAFGVIHGDYGPQNFHYLPGSGITSFDFGNACHHWYAMDVAVSLSVLRRFRERDRYRRWLLEGYREVCEPDPESWRQIGWFLRLRIVYVYLSRLWLFGARPTPEQREILDRLKAAVLERFDWPLERAGPGG